VAMSQLTATEPRGRLFKAGRFDPVTEAILRAGVALGLVGIALIHVLDLFSKLDETPYLAVAYLGLIVASLVVAARLVRVGTSRVLLLAAGLAAATAIAYVLSRTAGLPQATDDVGNWREPLGLASLFMEGLVIALSVYTMALSRPARRLVGLADPRG